MQRIMEAFLKSFCEMFLLTLVVSVVCFALFSLINLNLYLGVIVVFTFFVVVNAYIKLRVKKDDC